MTNSEARKIGEQLATALRDNPKVSKKEVFNDLWYAYLGMLDAAQYIDMDDLEHPLNQARHILHCAVNMLDRAKVETRIAAM